MAQVLELAEIRSYVAQVAPSYDIHKVTLFGSYANGTRTNISDIDLLVDFGPNPVSIFKVSGFKVELEDLTHKEVDVVPLPLSKDTLLEIDKEVVLYEY